MSCIEVFRAVCYTTGVDFQGRLTHVCLILIVVIQSVREIKGNLGLWEFGDSKL